MFDLGKRAVRWEERKTSVNFELPYMLDVVPLSNCFW